MQSLYRLALAVGLEFRNSEIPISIKIFNELPFAITGASLRATVLSLPGSLLTVLRNSVALGTPQARRA